MKNEMNFFMAGLFIGLVIIGGIFAFTQPTPKIIPEVKMTDCIKSGGEYRVSDWSLRDDGSDYRMTCKIPEQILWQVKY